MAQLEVNFLHGDPLKLADQVFLFKRTAREAAYRHNMYATFMAKPHQNQPGSAMHLHQSVIDIKTGKNIFATNRGKPTRLFLNYLGGLQQYMPAAMPLVAPNVNSYRRIARYMSAPINTHWGYDNRTRTGSPPGQNRNPRAWKTASPAPIATPTWPSPHHWRRATWEWWSGCARRNPSKPTPTNYRTDCRGN